MSYPTARVGSLTKGGDEIIHGSDSVNVDPSYPPHVSTTFQGKTIVFDEADIAHGEQDDEESDTGSMSLGTGPNGTVTPQDAARGAANQPSFGSGIDATLQPNNAQPLPTDCSQITGSIPYTMQLSTNFKLQDLSQNAVFSHQIQAQHGLSVSQIVCYLKALANNPLEQVAAKYGRSNMLISSGFRPASGTSPNSAGTPSQHELGQAADVHLPNLSPDDFWAAAQWVQANVMYDQLILELAGPIGQGHTPWLHLSFKKDGPNRKAVKTWRGNQTYTNGLTRLF